ncbi:uncharacterized protein LOC106660314 [Trichogramma pretiosum]|uniref:uncharacterized protein LOC106660314 n=1 Tax=Trichogramma pretiosum TaxID=7493 RepID=UPI0006C9E55D|nr:uncharacterized protein LOC106660314 [Trichogramma pretiosum]
MSGLCRIVLLMCALAASQLQLVQGHGMVLDPVNRSSAWRKGFKVPPNYEDSENFCGGLQVQHHMNGGKCGLCGDNYALAQPRPNENGGKYGRGVIVRSYKEGQEIDVKVKVEANHKGYFEFSLCPLSDGKQLESEECFDAHPLKLADGSSRHRLSGTPFQYEVDLKLKLPEGLKCEHCVLRWYWITANNWGTCADGSEALGCGPHEHYRTCSDIRID